MRVGIGFDAHKFAAGRRLVLGGVEIPFDVGLSGHSDADVVCHALIDALLGAIGAGDIGAHFPDSDSRYKDISSLKLLAQTRSLLDEAGFKLSNIDITIALELPKLAGWRDRMREALGRTLGLEVESVSVKATTTEGLGFTGRGEGAAAWAVALVEEKSGE